MRKSASRDRPSDDIIDLRFLFAAIWRGKLVVLALALLGALYGYWELRSAVPTYLARMVVMSSSSSVTSSAIGAISQFLGPLGPNIGVPSVGSSAFGRLVLLISSPTLAARLQEKHGYLRKVFGSQWDSEEKRWIRPTGAYFEIRERIRRFSNLATWSEPSVDTLASYLDSAIEVGNAQTKGFTEISMKHPDPEYALEVLSTVYQEADRLLRAQDREETTQNRLYLREQLSKVTEVDLRSALIALLISEEQREMFLKADYSYGARIVQPPHVSDQPIYPNPSTYVAGPAVVGALVGLALVMLFALFRRETP